MNAWDRPLNVQEVDDYIEGCSGNYSLKYKPKAINWSNATYHIFHRGNSTSEAPVPMEDICPLVNNTNKVTVKVMNYKLGFQRSRELCNQLGGKMPLPSLKKNENVTFGNNMSFTVPFDCKSQFWMPIVKSKKNVTRYQFMSGNCWKRLDRLAFLSVIKRSSFLLMSLPDSLGYDIEQ
jgi:hypothetical protein